MCLCIRTRGCVCISAESYRKHKHWHLPACLLSPQPLWGRGIPARRSPAGLTLPGPVMLKQLCAGFPLRPQALTFGSCTERQDSGPLSTQTHTRMLTYTVQTCRNRSKCGLSAVIIASRHSKVDGLILAFLKHTVPSKHKTNTHTVLQLSICQH